MVKFQKNDILDIGCGIGYHIKELQTHRLVENELYKYNFTGVDSSQDMLKEANILLNDKKRKKGLKVTSLLNHDANDSELFAASSFSHIVCYYFTLYSLKIEELALNVHKWLRSGGFFVVHVCDRDLFDPILDVSNPFVGISMQHNPKNRKTSSSAKFDNLVYNADFQAPPNETKVFFHEEFIFKDSNTIRKQTHVLDMISVKKTIEIFDKYQLTLVKTVDLKQIGYHNQYILYFQNI
jgi:SAM-dependent methyltransferase